MDDPAMCADGVRRCCATSRLGTRCGGIAIRDYLLCAVHDGRADPAAGGRAKAARYRREREQAEERAVLMRLGTRGAVAAVLSEKAEQVADAVRLLVDDAADESRPHAERLRSAQALIGWIDQALGKPVTREERKPPSISDEYSQMSTEELEAIVAEGRRRRLSAAAHGGSDDEIV